MGMRLGLGPYGAGVGSALLPGKLHDFSRGHVNLVNVGAFLAPQPGHMRLTQGHVLKLGVIDPLAIERNDRVGDRFVLQGGHQAFVFAAGMQQSQLRPRRIGLMQARLVKWLM
jgi:hypothetical protein